MKNTGLALLVVGIAIAAAFGSRNPPSVHEANVLQGHATFAADRATEALGEYCDAVGAVGGGLPHYCPDAPEGAAEEVPEAEGDVDIAALRAAWDDAEATADEAREAADAHVIDAPGARLSAWIKSSGAPFAGGLLLVVLGAIIARSAGSRDGDEPTDESGAPIDFQVLLGQLAEEVHALAGEVAAIENPSVADFAAVKARVEILQQQKVERLISARKAVERRYGLKTFAAIFNPLSGGERLLNRSWATLSDHHWPETTTSLAGAAEAFDSAVREIPG